MRRLTHDQRKELVGSMTDQLFSLYINGDIAKLGDMTTEIISLQKNHVSALTFKGIYFKEKSQYKNALRYLEHASSLDPNNKFTLVHLGSVYIYFRKYTAAAKTFKKALVLDPVDTAILLMRGDTLVKLERNFEALECYLAAIKLNPSNLNFRIGKARAQRRMEDWGTTDTLERILMVDPENLMALKEKAITLSILGKYTKAMEEIEKALKISPKDLEANLIQGKIYERWDKYQEAYESFLSAENIDKRNVMIISKKVSMLFQLKDKKNMISEFQKLEILFKEDEFKKFNKLGNMIFTEARLKYMKELIAKASNFLSEGMKYDPDKDLFQYLHRHEHIDFFAFLMTKLEIASDIDRFTSEKQIRSDIKAI